MFFLSAALVRRQGGKIAESLFRIVREM